MCGHSHCGAMQGLLDPDSIEKLPAVKKWLGHAEATRRIIEENYTHLSDPERRLTAAVEENVLVQLEHLRTHPAVAAALGRGELRLHGWVYAFERGWSSRSTSARASSSPWAPAPDGAVRAVPFPPPDRPTEEMSP